jgi:hypothetical protein
MLKGSTMQVCSGAKDLLFLGQQVKSKNKKQIQKIVKAFKS